LADVKKSWNVQHLGKITIGATDVKFLPSKREIAAKVFGQAEWERLTVKLTVGGGMAEDDFTGANVASVVTTAVTRNIRVGLGSSLDGMGADLRGKSKIDLSYKGSGAGSNLSLAVAGLLAYDSDGVTSTGGSVGAGIKGRVGGMPASGGVTGAYTRNFDSGSKPANEYKLMVTLSVGF
jgi:hypothetical protein